MKFYAVKTEKEEKIFTSWDEAKVNILGVKGVKHKSFSTRKEAELFFSELDEDEEDCIYTDGSCIDFGGFGFIEVENGKDVHVDFPRGADVSMRAGGAGRPETERRCRDG